MKFVVSGIGYVGLSNAVLLAQHNDVVALDVMEEKVERVNNRQATIEDKEVAHYLVNKDLRLTAMTDSARAFKDADFVIISTPTNYDPEQNYFDTSTVEQVIGEVVKTNPQVVMVIKSTIPVGYTEELRVKFDTDNI